MEAKFDLRELLSGCLSLSMDAMAVIRSVQKEREQGIVLESSMKDPLDSRTYLTKADLMAQRSSHSLYLASMLSPLLFRDSDPF